MKKRIISAIAALLMLFSLISLSVVAEEDVTDGKLSISPVGKVTAGSTFKLVLTLNNVSDEVLAHGVVDMIFALEYDHSLVNTTEKSISYTGVNDWEVFGNVSGKVCIFMMDDFEGKSPVHQNGTFVVTLVFTASENAAGKEVTIKVKDSTITATGTDSIDLEGDSVTFTVAGKSTTATSDKGVKYNVDTDAKTASVSGIEDKNVEDLIIPQKISYSGAEYKVTSVESGAFAGLTKLKSVYIPCTVTGIASDAADNKNITVKGCESSAAHVFATGNGFKWETDTSKYTEKVVKEPTCTEKGMSQLTCPDCGKKAGNAKELPALEHKYGDWVIIKAPTDDEEGSREKTCSLCGGKVTEKIPKTNCPHTDKKDVIVKPATCTETGIKNVVCSSCNKVIEASIEIPKAAHKFGEWVVTKPATVKEKGSRERTCSVCNAKETEEIPALECKHTNTANGHRDPTCTKDGYDSTTCKDCGKLLSYTVIKAKHTPGATDTQAPTCTEDGYSVQKCSVCGEELKKEVTPATGHEFGDWTELVAPTIDAEGTRAHTCTKCGTTENEAIPKLEAPDENSTEESVPPLESSDLSEDDSNVSQPTTSKDDSSGGSNKTVFFVIGAIVILLTVAYIVIMAINKRKNY